MCGLTGILYKSGSYPDPTFLKKKIEEMTETLKSRGPDGKGIHLDKHIALGHRRLKILDLSENGSQPMQLSEGGAVIVFNGEIYNFNELKKELALKGCQFRSRSDTEVILHAYEQWGFEGLKRLEGIFAFAIWDPQKLRLILFRDRLGVKPLFYSDCDKSFIFGSEIKSILKSSEIDISINDQALTEYLWYGNAYEDRSFYKNIKALLPGQYIVLENNRKEIGYWWKIEEWLEKTRYENYNYDLIQDALDNSVERQLVADVPVCIFLSGGIDSSAIAASVEKKKINTINSYTASFDFDQGIDESEKSLFVSNHLGLNNHHLKIEGKDLISVIERLAQAHDEPFADAANIPLYLMCKQLDPKIKVVLQGDGGDELFAGYIRYQILCYEKIFKLFPTMGIKILRQLGIRGLRYARLLDAVTSKDPAIMMALLLTLETNNDNPNKLFTTQRRKYLETTTDPFLAYKNAATRFQNFDTIEKMLLTDLTVQLPSQFLTKVDRATMAAGIEARVPLLDEKVAEIAIRIPSNQKVNLRQKKIPLRNSLRSRLPSSILDGPKTGFGVPYEYWVKTSLYQYTKERILDDQFINKFEFKKDLIEKKLFEHHSSKSENGFMIWKLLQLSLWMENNN